MCWEYGFDTLEGIQSFGFKNPPGGSGKIKPIWARSAVTVVLLHSNAAIGAGSGGYQIQ